MTEGARLTVTRGDVALAVTDRGGDGPPMLLLHGLAGSSRELLPTAEALEDSFRVLLMDQRGHGGSARRPTDLSRGAFVDDVVAVMDAFLPGQRCTLVGQSMGAYTAFLTAAARPDLVERLVMLEGHVAGSTDPEDAVRLGRFFASWPAPFADEAAAQASLGRDAVADAWVADLEVPTLALFAHGGMFSAAEKDELIRRRPVTDRVDLVGGSHDAHLDAFDEWVDALRGWAVGGAPHGASCRVR